jgi:FtsZ-binding cell division protein ZapB
VRLDREDIKDIKEALICDKDRRPLSYTCCIELFETIEGLYGDVDSLMEQLNRNIFAMDDAEAKIEALQQENEQLQELAKAKADGRLVVLPVKVGDTVYIAVKEWDARYCLKSSFVPCVREGTVAHICISHKGIIVCVTVKGEYSEYYEFGKTVFLTREAAEKALGVGE